MLGGRQMMRHSSASITFPRTALSVKAGHPHCHDGGARPHRQVGQHVAHQQLVDRVGAERLRCWGMVDGRLGDCACWWQLQTQSSRVRLTISMMVGTPQPPSPTSHATAPSYSTSLRRLRGLPKRP